MKELEQFTVERLEGLIGDAETWSFVKLPSRELKALARIALAAKRAEPIYQYQSGICNDQFDGIEWVWDDCDKGFYNQYDHTRRRIVYTTPQFKSQEIPEGWKLVPIELTAEMAQAAREAHEGESYLPYSIYRAMIAAAPEKPL
ncbi:hypothetical protein AXW37_12310 [Yersinia ruckeri]|uniref:hypothetical protein n=1 Tax=Yersinia ruckeri TaxID=29486 RepID=UPI0008FDA520|nr:hypothetical protein [Yersinia ruckeri]OJC57057.1 hypothetical protein AXW37_12310 [Yersinia ruckeri]OJC85897.1 hypothetical protein AXW45_12250 [Yersinia ruckeri]